MILPYLTPPLPLNCWSRFLKFIILQQNKCLVIFLLKINSKKSNANRERLHSYQSCHAGLPQLSWTFIVSVFGAGMPFFNFHHGLLKILFSGNMIFKMENSLDFSWIKLFLFERYELSWPIQMQIRAFHTHMILQVSCIFPFQDWIYVKYFVNSVTLSSFLQVLSFQSWLKNEPSANQLLQLGMS